MKDRRSHFDNPRDYDYLDSLRFHGKASGTFVWVPLARGGDFQQATQATVGLNMAID
jgi:hypothetical protein